MAARRRQRGRQATWHERDKSQSKDMVTEGQASVPPTNRGHVGGERQPPLEKAEAAGLSLDV